MHGIYSVPPLGKLFLSMSDDIKMTQFKDGTQWRTKGGNRAVVLLQNIPQGNLYTFLAWHEQGFLRQHTYNGRAYFQDIDEYALVEPWESKPDA